jgi:hypothetical protein
MSVKLAHHGLRTADPRRAALPSAELATGTPAKSSDLF